jgi:hypothetical protein
VFAGILCAVKLNGFFALVALIAVWAFDSIPRMFGAKQPESTPRLRTFLTELAVLCLPSVLFGAPWLIKSWIATGNPAYPLLFETFGGPDWSAALAEQHASWQRAIGMGRGLLDYLLLPFRVILEGDYGYEHFDGQIHRVWILLVPFALWSAVRDRESRRFLAACVVYFAVWSVTSQQMRFLIPILPLLAVAAARGLRDMLARLSSNARTGLLRGPGPALAIETVASLVVSALLIQAGWVYLEQAPRLARDLARQGAELKLAVVQPVYRFIASELPPRARLLLINTNHGFFVERDFLADSFFEASQIADRFSHAATREDVLALFRELGVTHVLVENRAGPAYPDALVTVLRDPSLSEPIYQSPDGRYVVLAVGG